MFSTNIKRIVEYWVSVKIIDDSDKDIYEYGLELLLFSVINIAVIMITAIFINRIIESVALLALVIPLQSFGGGYHAKTHLRCFLIMYIGWWLIMNLITYMTILTILVISIISLIAIFYLAPVSNENVPLSNKQRLKMRKLARFAAVVALITIIVMSLIITRYENISSVLAIGLGATALSMIVERLKDIANKFIEQ